MKDAFLEFLQQPSPESFGKVRRLILESPHYAPYSKQLDEIDALIQEGSFERAREAVQAAMPNFLLSPRAHIYAAFLARQRGDKEAERIEGYLATLCAQAILTTGDGSEERPYLVMRVSDEYDVLRFLEKDLASPSLVTKGEKHLDRVTLTGGEVLWFDISDAYQRLHLAPEGGDLPN